MTEAKKTADAADRRKQTVERVLVPAGPETLTLEALERKCLTRLTRLLIEAALWRPGDCGPAWRIGDYRILIIETTVAPDAIRLLGGPSDSTGRKLRTTLDDDEPRNRPVVVH
jgi:hypothetical protein